VTVVIDAGVVVALIVADERQDAARAHLESWLDADEALHAPAVLPYEIANVLVRLVFDRAIEISEVLRVPDRSNRADQRPIGTFSSGRRSDEAGTAMGVRRLLSTFHVL
jgi:predicted nucleic acid-binding protein